LQKKKRCDAFPESEMLSEVHVLFFKMASYVQRTDSGRDYAFWTHSKKYSARALGGGAETWL
jgi:hypothetical protein